MIKKIEQIYEQAKQYQKELPAKKPVAMPNKEDVAGWIDHTILKPESTVEQVAQVCREAMEYRFASVCLNPVFIPQAVKELKGSGIPVASVIGFPLGANQTATKVAEAQAAIDAGVGELDMVLPVGLLKSGEYESVYNDIRAVAATCHEHDIIIKVIIETCYLDRFEKIVASLLAKEAQADFVKTSTGFGTGGAMVEDVSIMRSVVGGPEVMGVKASGGIRSWADVQKMIAAGANRIGASSGVRIVKEAQEES